MSGDVDSLQRLLSVQDLLLITNKASMFSDYQVHTS